jgi:hypothetical protein
VVAASRPDNEGLPKPDGKVANISLCPQIDRNEPHPVLVSAVYGMEKPQQAIPSVFEWAERAEQRDCIGGELFLFRKGGFKFAQVFPEREFNFCVGATGRDYDLCQHVVQGRAKIVDDLTNPNREIGGQFFGEMESPDLFFGIKIEIGDNFIRGAFEEASYGDIEILDLGFGSLGLRERAE